MTPNKNVKDDKIDECKSIFVPWEKFLAIILTFVALALMISFSFGSTSTGMKRDIEENKTKISNHEERLKAIESTAEQLQLINTKLDTIIKRGN